MAKSVKKYICNAPLGFLGVDVVADPTTGGGEFRPRDGVTCRPTMTIGTSENWGWTVGVLVHEAMEACLQLAEHRYRCCVVSDYESDGTTGILFSFSHDDFNRATNDVGSFVAKVLPLLKTYWDSAHKGDK